MASDRSLAYLSSLTYLRFEKDLADLYRLKDRAATAGYNVVDVYDKRGTQAVLFRCKTEDDLVLAFRGTEKDGRDILTDLDIRYKRGRHRGFVKAWLEGPSSEIALEVLRQLKARRCRLITTGHSLGGALAIVAGEALQAHQVVTFGSPRVHTSEVTCSVPVTRYIHGWDIVPLVPFLFMGYSHVGDKVKVGRRSLIPRPFTDHRVKKYVDKTPR